MVWASTHAAIAAVLREYATGGTLVAGTDTITDCVESLATRQVIAERWGADSHYALTLTVPRSLLVAGLPTVRTTVTYRGTTMRILDLNENQSAGTVQLHLGDL